MKQNIAYNRFIFLTLLKVICHCLIQEITNARLLAKSICPKKSNKVESDYIIMHQYQSYYNNT